jgi:tRNA threonylcarbamoyladenosine biosynthesis protein TsaB
MILGIETATSRLSVALIEGDAPLCSASILARNAHDALLVPWIERMMRDAGRPMDALTAIAVSAGPGSFTGLRIGMAAAKGYALSLGIPLIAVPTFDAMAFRAAQRLLLRAQACSFAPVFDARKDDVYLAGYRLTRGAFVLEIAACALDINAAMDLLPEYTIISGDGSEKLAAMAKERFEIAPEREQLCHAEGVAFVGRDMLLRGEIADAAACEPIYLRDFLTTTPKPNPLSL